MTVAKSTSASFEPAPAGTHRAICVQVIELGTLPQSNPQFSETFKIMLGFELCDVEIEGRDENGDPKKTRQIISKEYTLSIGDKANLCQDLTSWRGRPFTDQEKDGFDMKNVLGVPALLSVIHKKNQQGMAYAKINAVMGPQKDMRDQWPKPTHELIQYEVNRDFTDGPWAQLPDWVKKKIGTSEEYQCKARAAGHDQPNHDPSAPAGLPEDDDVPF